MNLNDGRLGAPDELIWRLRLRNVIEIQGEVGMRENLTRTLHLCQLHGPQKS